MDALPALEVVAKEQFPKTFQKKILRDDNLESKIEYFPWRY